ncbi:MAG: hypothetical protein LUD72_10765, partial [Bacteroidales bacterium]|nr:hypothetical protein [Bacteroidales bacterium]
MTSHLLSDQGYCVGFNSANSYIYIYAVHDPSIIYIGIEEEDDAQTIVASHYCAQCFEYIEKCSGPIAYVLNGDGTARAYVEEEGCVCYGLGAPDEGGVRCDEEGGLYLDAGVLVTDATGATCWYPDASTALENTTGDCKVTLLGDVGGEGISIELKDGQNVTLDLNGHSVGGNVTATGSGTLVITDSLGGGSVEGTVSTGSGASVTISVSGGTYSAEAKESMALDEGYWWLDNEDGTYTVYSETEMENYAVAYIASGDSARIYYKSLGKAVSEAGVEDTITLCNNIDISTEEAISIEKSVEIDLAGYTLAANFEVKAGTFTSGTASGEPIGSLKITDTSDYKTGRISGTIIVVGSSDDADSGDTNSFADTLTIVATAVDPALYVDLEKLTSSGEGVEYSFSALTETEGSFDSYGIVKGHEHYWTIAEAYEDENGDIKIKIKCSCGEYYTSESAESGNEADEFDLPEGAEVTPVENGDGTVTYYITHITLTDGSVGAIGVGTFTADYTTEPLVKIEYTDGESNAVVVYLDENTIGSINDVLATDGAANFTITLWTDVDLGDVLGGDEALEISKGSVTIDLNGHT